MRYRSRHLRMSRPPRALPVRLPRLVALVVLDPADRWRLADIFRDRASIAYVRTVSELREQLEAAEVGRDVAAVLVEPVDIDGAFSAPLIAQFRPRLVGVPFIAYCTKGIEHSQELLALARAGVDEIVFRGDELSRVTLGEALATATQSSAAADVLARIRNHLPDEAEPFVAHTLYHAGADFDVPALAAAFGVNHATLLRRFRRMGLPAPGPFIMWCRLLLAGYLLQDGLRAVEDVVLALGFPSPSAFRNLTKRYTGLRPLELRAAGGLQAVLEAFLAPGAFGRALRLRGRGHSDAADEELPYDEQERA